MNFTHCFHLLQFAGDVSSLIKQSGKIRSAPPLHNPATKRLQSFSIRHHKYSFLLLLLCVCVYYVRVWLQLPRRRTNVWIFHLDECARSLCAGLMKSGARNFADCWCAAATGAFNFSAYILFIRSRTGAAREMEKQSWQNCAACCLHSHLAIKSLAGFSAHILGLFLWNAADCLKFSLAQIVSSNTCKSQQPWPQKNSAYISGLCDGIGFCFI